MALLLAERKRLKHLKENPIPWFKFFFVENGPAADATDAPQP
jgi:hypothetical protein